MNLGGQLTLHGLTAVAGVPTDDPGITLTVEAPDGSSVVHPVGDLAHPGDGQYSLVVAGTQAGLWRYTWAVSAGFSGQDAGIFLVGTALYPFRPWCTPAEVAASPALAKVTNPDGAWLERSCVAATEFLTTATFRRFRGLREVELRPCCTCSFQRMALWMAWPVISAAWVGRPSPDPVPVIEGVAPCGCSYSSEVVLPDDVALVTAVKIDGEVFTGWRLDSGKRLIRTDDLSWPCCSNVALPDTEDHTFSVHVVVGEEPMELAGMAAVELAAEFFLALADPSQCRLPTRVQNVTRQGVSWTKVDTTTLTKDGQLGLRLCDIFLSRFGKRRQRMRIASPETPELARRLGHGPY